MMTNQEVFTKVVMHLLTQNERSVDGGGCAYRGPNGLKCAIGCLIPDETYHPSMEGKSIGLLMGSYPEIYSLFNELTSKLEFLHRLQSIHDWYPPTQWKRLLVSIAEDLNLKFPQEENE